MIFNNKSRKDMMTFDSKRGKITMTNKSMTIAGKRTIILSDKTISYYNEGLGINFMSGDGKTPYATGVAYTLGKPTLWPEKLYMIENNVNFIRIQGEAFDGVDQVFCDDRGKNCDTYLHIADDVYIRLPDFNKLSDEQQAMLLNADVELRKVQILAINNEINNLEWDDIPVYVFN